MFGRDPDTDPGVAQVEVCPGDRQGFRLGTRVRNLPSSKCTRANAKTIFERVERTLLEDKHDQNPGAGERKVSGHDEPSAQTSPLRKHTQ
jgi:hypothetical protein